MARVQKIFISYRRKDAADVAGRIRDWLVQNWHISSDNVFMDVATILPGADFEQVIDQAIAQCDAMIVVMSPSWRTHVNATGTSFPRFEAETALQRNLLVIPVLVGGMPTPTEEQLPHTLRPLLRRNIRPIRADSFDYDMEWVRRALGVKRASRASLVTAIAIVLVLAMSLGTLSQVPVGNPIWKVFHASSDTPSATRTLRPATQSPTPARSSAGPSTTQAGAALPKRDCLGYNPNNVSIAPYGDGAWRVISPDAGAMLLLDNQADAEKALILARKFHQQCFLGRGNKRTAQKQYIFEYWLDPDNAVVAIPNADCITYNPAAVRYESFGSAGWRLVETLSSGQISSMALLDTAQDAQDALTVAKHYTKQCFIGRGNKRTDRDSYIVQYWQ